MGVDAIQLPGRQNEYSQRALGTWKKYQERRMEHTHLLNPSICETARTCPRIFEVVDLVMTPFLRDAFRRPVFQR